MKVATIIYHKNILSIYRREWIYECFNSILNQTYTDFTIYELNYGDDNLSLCNSVCEKNGKEYKYFNEKFNNHAEAMNFLLEKCLEDGFDAVMNNNMDDYSEKERFEIQLKKIEEGFDIVSSNFNHIDSESTLIRKMDMSHRDICIELEKGHNIIAHPSVCYSKKFISENKYIGDEIPEEDLKLWKRTYSNYRFFICPEFLLNYRVHNNQITKQHEKKPILSERLERLIEKKDKIRRDAGQIQQQEPITVRKSGQSIDRCNNCGEVKNKVRYNFCQKCNKLY